MQALITLNRREVPRMSLAEVIVLLKLLVDLVAAIVELVKAFNDKQKDRQ